MWRVFKYGKWDIGISLTWDWRFFGVGIEVSWDAGFSMSVQCAFWMISLNVIEPLDLDDPIVED